METLLYCIDYTYTLYVNVNNHRYKLNRIFFYNEEKGIICSLHHFTNEEFFKFKGETKLRRKVRLNRKENFIKKSDYNDYNLYIYAKNVDLEYLGKVVLNCYYWGDENVMSSNLYRKYNINGYIHDEYVKSLFKKKSKLEYKMRCLLGECFPETKILDDDVLDKKLQKIKKLNARIRKENEKLILREKLNI